MKLGFIGIGKIASAVIEGLCTSTLNDITIYLSPRNQQKASELDSKFTNTVKAVSNQQVLDLSEIVFIALRPADAVEELKKLQFRPQHIVVSFIPYLTYPEIKEVTKSVQHISRAIPLPTVVHHNCPIPVFNPNQTVLQILGAIGQPLEVGTEKELHSIWTLTGLITPYYDLMGTLSQWTQKNGVEEKVANKYMADLFQSLSYAAQHSKEINFGELANHAATPNGMNEQAGKEIHAHGGHEIYKTASDNLLAKFLKNF